MGSANLSSTDLTSTSKSAETTLELASAPFASATLPLQRRTSVPRTSGTTTTTCSGPPPDGTWTPDASRALAAQSIPSAAQLILQPRRSSTLTQKNAAPMAQ